MQGDVFCTEEFECIIRATSVNNVFSSMDFNVTNQRKTSYGGVIEVVEGLVMRIKDSVQECVFITNPCKAFIMKIGGKVQSIYNFNIGPIFFVAAV